MLALAGSAVLAVATPHLQLAYKADAPDDLHFCLDLLGWNPPTFQNMQAHSCKPNGGTDEEFVPQDGAIVGRADADGRCMTAHSAAAGSGFDADPCDGSDVLQRFDWDAASGSLVLQGTSLCVAVGEEVRPAGPYYARDLLLSECGQPPGAFQQWEVNGAAPADSPAPPVAPPVAPPLDASPSPADPPSSPPADASPPASPPVLLPPGPSC